MAYMVGQVPTLRTIFAIFTEGAAPREDFEVPAGASATLSEVPAPSWLSGSRDELFGPAVASFRRFQPKRAFLLALSRETQGRAGSFFDEAKRVLGQSTSELEGFGLDVLRMWPFELHGAGAMVEEETLAEDIFSVGFTERGEHGLRAETFGLAKLGQREVTFEFSGHELMEEAAFMCAHLVDWLLEQGQRIDAGQELSFGLDRLVFLDPSRGEHPFRGWHPPLVQQLVPPTLFPGVGVLGVRARPFDGACQEQLELTECLSRSLDQRLVLEDLDLTGDAPHAGATATVRGTPEDLRALVAVREQHLDRRDSGWRFEASGAGPQGASRVVALSEVARTVPGLVRYLSLPWGVRLEWDARGLLSIDTSRVHHLEAGGSG